MRLLAFCSLLLISIQIARGQIIYVDPSATGNGNGASWANAITDLQTAINTAGGSASAAFPLQVWVKSGTYQSNTGTDRTTTFELHSYVELYGGFAGTESSLSQRDIASNPTIITGDIGVANDKSDNIYQAFSSGLNYLGTMVIDGFTIADFHDPTGLSGSTGLIQFVLGSIDSVAYTSCTFRNNEIAFGSVFGFKSFSAYFNSCKFIENGGSTGTTFWNISSNGLTIANSLFTGNNLPINQQAGTLTLINNTFYNNSGNAVFIQNQPTANVTFIHNNIFSENTGTDLIADGNAVGAMTLINNLFQDQVTLGTNSIIGDPQFTDVSMGDFTLRECSPAIEQGDLSVLPPGITTDLNGDNRVFGTVIDLGAFEAQVAPLSFASFTAMDVVCHGGNSGQIAMTAQGGSGPYEYSLDGVNFHTSGTFTGLSAGNYQAQAREVGSTCILNQSVTISEPNETTLQYSVQTGAAANLIAITATGDNGPFDYSLDGSSFSAGPFALTSSGTYTLYARDANNCVTNKQVYLTSSGNEVIFLDPDATGDGTGSSWANAITDLQNALDQAAIDASVDFPTEVWAKTGTYYTDIQTSTDRTKTISMRNNVHLLGGFIGTETDSQQRDILNNPTILSGDIGVLNDSTDNSYGMLAVGSDITDETTIDGWQINNAFSLSVAPTNGAIHMVGDAVELNVKNCSFRFNLSNEGACIRMKELTNDDARLNVESTTFAENGFYTNTNYIGSAIYTKGTVIVSNSLMYDNKSGRGGAFFTDLATDSLVVVNSTMASNHASNGPLMFISSGPTRFRIRNSILFENTNFTTYAIPILQGAAPGIHIASNNLSDDTFINQYDGANNIIDDPQFLDADNFNFRINYCSPAVNEGDNSFLSNLISEDLDGNPRQFNEIDIGAFEVQADPFLIASINVQQPACSGAATGSLEILAAGGSGPVEFSLDGTSFVPSGDFTGITAGTYNVAIRDANGCERTETVVLTEPDALVSVSEKTDPTCFGSDDGQISVTGSGGTGTISYSIDGGTNFFSSGTFTDLTPGTYNVVLSDDNACLSSPEVVTITEPAAAKTPVLESSFTTTYGIYVQSDSLTIDPDPTDLAVTYFQITNIVNGTLTLSDNSAINENDFIAVADAQAGLIFSPDQAGTGGFSAQASATDEATCLAGSIVSTDITINKASLATAANDQTTTYGESIPALSLSYSGFVGTDDQTDIDTAPSASTTAVQGDDAGTYTIDVSGGSDDNYEFDFNSGTLTIEKAVLTASGIDTTVVYGDTLSQFSVTYSGFVGTDDESVIDTPATATSTASTGDDVGTYDITASGASDNNYDFTYETGTLTIGQASLTVTAIDQSVSYGDSIPDLSFNYTGFVGMDDEVVIDTAPGISTTASIGDDAGNYDIQLSGGSDNNYSFDLVNGTLTIDKASVTASADDQTITFGDSIPAFSISFSGFFGTDDESDLDESPTASTTASFGDDAGTYDIVVSGGSDNNYDFTFNSGTLTIIKADQTITFPAIPNLDLSSDSILTLNATSDAGLDIAYTISSGGSIASIQGDVLTLTGTGTVTVEASQSGDGNYNAASVVSQTFNVTDASKTDQTITFTDDLSDKTYGDSTMILTASSSSNLAITYVTTGPVVVSNDSLSFTGAGAASVTAIQAGDDTFNPATSVTLDFTIAKAPLSVTADELNITFGDSIPVYTLTYAGFIGEDDTSDLDEVPSATSQATNGSDAGEYTIEVSGGTDDDYSFTLINGTLTIGLADQTLTFHSIEDFDLIGGNSLVLEASSSIGAPVTFSITKGNDLATLSGDTLLFNSGTGHVSIQASADATQNHKAAVATASFRVFNSNLQEQTIAIDTLSESSYGDLLTLSATASSGLPVTFQLIQGEGSIDGNELQITGIGSYIIRADQSGDTSFNAAPSSFDTLQVNKAALLIAADDITVVEGEEIPPLTLTYTGFVLNEDTSVLDSLPSVSTTATSTSASGTYPIEVAGGNDDLYELSYENGTLTIETILSTVLTTTSFRIYPNPTASFLHFEAEEGQAAFLKLIDLQGRTVFRSENPATEHTLDMNPFPEGIYVLEISHSQKQIIQRYRILKQ